MGNRNFGVSMFDVCGKTLLQRRPLFYIFSQHAMVRRALIVINVIRYSSLRKAWMNTSLPDQVVEAMHQFTDKRLSKSVTILLKTSTVTLRAKIY